MTADGPDVERVSQTSELWTAAVPTLSWRHAVPVHSYTQIFAGLLSLLALVSCLARTHSLAFKISLNWNIISRRLLVTKALALSLCQRHKIDVASAGMSSTPTGRGNGPWGPGHCERGP